MCCMSDGHGTGLLCMQAQMQAVVMTNATVVIGYCFGAAAILDLAASWPNPITDNVLGKHICNATCVHNCLSQVHTL
jgi:hypothetical protein